MPRYLDRLRRFSRGSRRLGDKESPKLRALEIVQKLLVFHRGDERQDAFLLADLERLRWAAATAGDDAGFEKALRKFTEQHAKHPISAWARVDLGGILESQEETKEAHGVYQAGAEAFPDHPFGKFCRNEVQRMERKELTLSTETHWTPAGEEIHVSHRNLKRVWFRLYSVAFKPSLDTVGRDPLPDQRKWLPAMLKGGAGESMGS